MTLARSGPEGDTYPLAAAFDAFRTAAFFCAAALRKTVREALESIGHDEERVKGVRDGPPWTSRSKLPSDFVMFVAAPLGRSRIGLMRSRQKPDVARSGAPVTSYAFVMTQISFIFYQIRLLLASRPWSPGG